mgnify:FL=1
MEREDLLSRDFELLSLHQRAAEKKLQSAHEEIARLSRAAVQAQQEQQATAVQAESLRVELRAAAARIVELTG